MSPARLTRVALLALLLGALIALAIGVWTVGPESAPARPVAARWVGSRSEARAPLTATASSAAPDAPAALAIDARSAGTLPYAWRAAQGDEAPWLSLRFRAPIALAAVLVRGLDGDAASLVLDDKTLGAGRRFSDLVWWQLPPASPAVQELRVTGARSVAEIVPIFAGADTWLVQQTENSDWNAEILTGHGIRPLAAIPASVLDQLPSLARAPGRLIVPDERLDTSVADALRARVEEGWTLLELGPRSGVCGAASQSGAAQRIELSAHDGERFHWVGSLAPHVPCARCTRGEAVLRGPLGEPALIAEQLGRGVCLRWLSDWPAGVRRLRQGAAERAGQDTIGADGLKPADLLVDDLQPTDYASPHADRLIERTLAALAPGQRLHLLPPELPGLLIMTIDQDYAPDAALLAQFEAIDSGTASALLTDATFGAPPDVDFKQFSIDRLSSASAARLEQRGHTAGIHASLLHLPAGPPAYAATLKAHAAAFAQAYGAAPRIARNHHLVWDGFVTMAESQARAGIAMNLDYMALAYRGRGALGFLNGSAFPLRFAAADGTLLPIYQQGTQLDDHVLLAAKFGYEPMQVDDLVNAQHKLFDQAVSNDPHPITVNHHPAWWHSTHGAWQRALLAEAKRRKIAVWDAAHWLRHVEAVRETLIVRTGERSLRVLSGAADVALLLPQGTKVSAQGKALALRSRRVGGRDYAWVGVPASSDLQLDVEP